MYKTNIILKSIFLLAFILITVLTSIHILFWSLLLYLVYLAIKDRNIKALILDIVLLLILLFVKFDDITRVILIVLMIINILLIYFNSFTKNEVEVLKEHLSYSNIKKRKKFFYQKYENKIKEKCENSLSFYNSDEKTIDNKVNRELDKLYLYGKVRFFGYDNKMTSILSKWTINDLVFLLVSLTLLIFLRIIWS